MKEHSPTFHPSVRAIVFLSCKNHYVTQRVTSFFAVSCRNLLSCAAAILFLFLFLILIKGKVLNYLVVLNCPSITEKSRSNICTQNLGGMTTITISFLDFVLFSFFTAVLIISLTKAY